MCQESWTTHWSFVTKNFRVTFDTIPEEQDPADSFEDTRVLRDIRNGNIDWFTARVAVWLTSGDTPLMLNADYLGACAYHSAAEFRYGGGYFPDMVRAALKGARDAYKLLPRLREAV